MSGDLLTVEGDDQPGEPLLKPVMKAGRRIEPAPTLAEVRARVTRQLEKLPEPLRSFDPGRLTRSR